jgi:nucleotidyltransferase substrate binding protein (TIGR01987 family)
MIHAYETLTSAFDKYTGDDLQRDGIIQRFEYNVELLWKTIKLVLEYQQIQIETISPKNIIRLAYHNHIISNSSVYADMIDCRNSLSHIYSEPASGEIFDYIQVNYQSIQTAIDHLSRHIAADE